MPCITKFQYAANNVSLFRALIFPTRRYIYIFLKAIKPKTKAIKCAALMKYFKGIS